MPDVSLTGTDVQPPPEIAQAVDFIRSREQRVPQIVLVLGSGLGDLADAADNAFSIPTSEIPNFPKATVEGHKGRLVFGRLEGKDVLFVQGRAHYYEGHPIRKVVFPVRLAHALGARYYLVTNAAGGVNAEFTPGTLMFIRDHINYGNVNPLIGPNEESGPRFPDMSAPYDPEWLQRAEKIAAERGVAVKSGVYIFTTGPSYETKAEIDFFRLIGADAVGMSTVPEVIQARYYDMRVLGISTITNPAAGLNEEPLSHAEVLEVGQQIKGEIESLVRGIVADLPAQ